MFWSIMRVPFATIAIIAALPAIAGATVAPTMAPMNMTAASPAATPMVMPTLQPVPGISQSDMQQIDQVLSDTTHASPETPTQWSIFNHRAAGVFVLLWGLTAAIVGLMWPKQSWFRFAPPLVMLGLAEFLFIRNDPKAWPSGPIGFWISWHDPETAQHRIFVLLIVAIVIVELLRAAGKLTPFWNTFALPLLVVVTAVLLLFHQHGGIAMQQTMQHLSSGATPSPADQQMLTSMATIKHEHLIFALFGFGLGAARLAADGGLLKGRLGATLWALFAIGLGLYMSGSYTE
jgi:hypothetical protein